jgi:hypothetical protein
LEIADPTSPLEISFGDQPSVYSTIPLNQLLEESDCRVYVYSSLVFLWYKSTSRIIDATARFRLSGNPLVRSSEKGVDNFSGPSEGVWLSGTVYNLSQVNPQ